MTEKHGKPPVKPADPEKVSCDVCLAEIPKATAMHAEGRNYVYHFCGEACLAHWTKEKKREDL